MHATRAEPGQRAMAKRQGKPAMDNADLVAENIQAKLDRLKRDFDRGQKEIATQGRSSGALGRKESHTRTIEQSERKHLIGKYGPASMPFAELRVGGGKSVGMPGKSGAQTTQRMLSPQGAASVNDGNDGPAKADAYIAYQSQKVLEAKAGRSRRPSHDRHASDAGHLQHHVKPKRTLANILQSPPSSRTFRSHHDDSLATNDLLQQAVLAGKLPNEGQIAASGWTGWTPEDGRIHNEKMLLADKHRGVIRGVPKRVVAGTKQLYTEVDSDHQQKLLHSNIYIPDQDDDEYTQEDSEAQRAIAKTNLNSQSLNYQPSLSVMAASDGRRFSTLGADNAEDQRRHGRHRGGSDLAGQPGNRRSQDRLRAHAKRPSFGRPSQADEMERKFNSHFHKRQMSHVEAALKNIGQEPKKQGKATVAQKEMSLKRDKSRSSKDSSEQGKDAEGSPANNV